MKVGDVHRRHWFQRSLNRKTVSMIYLLLSYIFYKIYCSLLEFRPTNALLANRILQVVLYIWSETGIHSSHVPLVFLIIYVIILESSSIITVLENDKNFLTTTNEGYDDVTRYDDEVKKTSANISNVFDSERVQLLTDSKYIDINHGIEVWIVRGHCD